MNRLIFLLSLLTLLLSGGLSAETFPISDVTVYRSGATVVRTGAISLTSGDNLIEIGGLPYNIDLGTTQVILDPSIKVLSVRSDNDSRKLEQSQRQMALQDSIALLDIQKKLIEEQLSILGLNNKLSQDIQANYASELKKLMDYYAAETTKLRVELLSVQKQQRELQLVLTNLIKASADPSQTPRKKVILQLQSDKAMTTELGISYLVSQAGWSTEYDLYMTSLEEDMDLDYKGKVWNKTSEDWSEVQLTLTTALPSTDITAPELQEWWLREHYQNSHYDGLPTKNIAMLSGIYQNARISKSDDEAYGASNKVASYSEQITASVFKLNKLHTILRQTTDYTVVLSEQEIEADYYYKCTPKLSPQAYLYAKIKNVSNLVLSQGYLTVFAQGRMQGKTYFEPNKETDQLEIPLGVDYGVAVTRERIKDYSEVNFFRSKVKKQIGYEIVIKNNKSTAIQMELHDQLPLTTSEKIVVNAIEVGDADVKKETGVVTWKLIIDSKQKEDREIRYEVEQPKGMFVGV